MKRIRYDLDTCIDILDWFNDPGYEYLVHTLLSKLDGEQRLASTLPELRNRARVLVLAHRGCEDAYPETLTNLPA